MKRLVVLTLTLLFSGLAVADSNNARSLLVLAHQESMDATRATREGRMEDSLDHWKRSLELTEQAFAAALEDPRLNKAPEDSQIQTAARSSVEASYYGHLAPRAFNAGQFDKAMDYATSALEAVTRKAPHAYATDEDAFHHGHLVLGMLALRDDDIETAGAHLLEAGETSGSPVLGSFGPNMTLARELLQRGAREVVLEYLRLCREFWTMDNGRLDHWSVVVSNGGVPDFGGNLVYGF